MRPALIVITDGRIDCLRQTIASAELALVGVEWHQRLIVNDAATPAYEGTLEAEYPGWQQIHHDTRRGLSGSIQTAWAALDPEVDWIFHLEDDWVFPTPVNVAEMVDLCAYLGAWQVALKRQPVAPHEIARGGFMDDRYQDRPGWVESSFGFTLNPCVYPRTVAAIGWPDGGGEAEFTAKLRRLDNRPFAMFGAKSDPPRCLHIGHSRTASWRL